MEYQPLGRDRSAYKKEGYRSLTADIRILIPRNSLRNPVPSSIRAIHGWALADFQALSTQLLKTTYRKFAFHALISFPFARDCSIDS
jgi:hypothetical protein